MLVLVQVTPALMQTWILFRWYLLRPGDLGVSGCGRAKLAARRHRSSTCADDYWSTGLPFHRHTTNGRAIQGFSQLPSNTALIEARSNTGKDGHHYPPACQDRQPTQPWPLTAPGPPSRPWALRAPERSPASPSEYRLAENPSKIAQKTSTGVGPLMVSPIRLARRPCKWRPQDARALANKTPLQYGKPCASLGTCGAHPGSVAQVLVAKGREVRTGCPQQHSVMAVPLVRLVQGKVHVLAQGTLYCSVQLVRSRAGGT